MKRTVRGIKADEQGDFIIENGGKYTELTNKSVDFFGPPLSAMGSFNMTKFKHSIDGHMKKLNKGVDYLIMDIRALNSSQRTEVINYINTTHKTSVNSGKLVVIGN